MEWTDQAFVLGTRKHGETSVIAELMTRDHGRHLGLVRGGRSRRMRPILQPGNQVEATWRARLDEHLGQFQLEPLSLNAATLMLSPLSVYAVQTLASHLRLLPERDRHANLYDAFAIIVDHLHAPRIAGELLLRFELELLNDLGFGLDLTRCAASGTTDDLAWVSPKSGRAVNRQAGMPWKDKMLVLPEFLIRSGAGDQSRQPASASHLNEGYRLTGHFLTRNIYNARGMEEPSERRGLIAALLKSMPIDPGMP